MLVFFMQEEIQHMYIVLVNVQATKLQVLC